MRMEHETEYVEDEASFVVGRNVRYIVEGSSVPKAFERATSILSGKTVTQYNQLTTGNPGEDPARGIGYTAGVTFGRNVLGNTSIVPRLIGEYDSFFTARKRSLGQGNIFIGVGLSTGRRGGWLPSMHHRSHDQEGLPGGRSASSGGWADPPPQIHGILRDTVNKRAVHSLLECILVSVI